MVKGRERSRGKKKRELPPKEKAILKLKLRFIVIVERSNDRMRSILGLVVTFQDVFIRAFGVCSKGFCFSQPFEHTPLFIVSWQQY